MATHQDPLQHRPPTTRTESPKASVAAIIALALLASGCTVLKEIKDIDLEDIRWELPDLPRRPAPDDSRPDESRPQVGDVRFTREGVFHRPSRGRPTMQLPIRVSKDERYRRITLDFDFKHGGWFSGEPRNHSLFWLHRAKRWQGNVVAYVNAIGPSRNKFRMMTNVGSSANKTADKTGVRFQQGKTYHVRYVFDGTKRTMTTTITGNGINATARQQTPFQIVEAPNDGSGFFVYFGHSDHTGRGPERPTYGWEYSNLRLEMSR